MPGIVLSEFFPCSLPVAIIALLCFAAAIFRERSAVAFCLLVFTAFLIRHEIDLRRNPGHYPLELAERAITHVHATGIVTSDPLPAGFAMHTAHYRFEMRVTDLASRSDVFHAGFPVEVYWTGPAPVWGDEVSLAADISTIPEARNPGEFDESSYMARLGSDAEFVCNYASDNQVIEHDRGNPILAWARNARAFLERRLTVGIADDPEVAGLVETITLGLKQETSVADRELFQRVGALHLFVVNGLHIALLAGILALLLKPLGIRRRAFALVVIPILIGYTMVTGFSPGSVRAAIMAAVVFGASFVERRPFSFNSLAAAALILLVWDTNELFMEGFQFSFGVVAAILLLARWIEKPIMPLGLPDPFLPRLLWTRWQRGREIAWRWVVGLYSVSIAASIGALPFSATYFNLFTPSGLLANLLLVPLAFGILFEGIFSLIAAPLAILFNNTNWMLATWMLGVVHFFAYLPAGHFFVSTSRAAPPECRLTILDLEPGQAIVVESEGSVWLVDCGDLSSYLRIVRPFLEARGVNRLDGLILTHGASGSIGAAQQVVADFSPRQICESSVTDRSSTRRELEAALEKDGRAKTILETGDELALGPLAKCEVLYPPAGFVARTAADKSLVLRITDGDESVLLMADSGYTGEHWLLDQRKTARAAVVVLGGQSADMAGTGAFLTAVHAFAVVRGEPGFTGSAASEREWVGGCYRVGVRPVVQSAAGAVTIDLTQAHLVLTGFVNGQRIMGG
jgi:ComEC/Rec2-related protein